jgi:hypothetical protein
MGPIAIAVLVIIVGGAIIYKAMQPVKPAPKKCCKGKSGCSG